MCVACVCLWLVIVVGVLVVVACCFVGVVVVVRCSLFVAIVVAFFLFCCWLCSLC